MNEDSLDLYISGGTHITRPKRRIKTIEDVIGDVDIVFVEAPRANSPGWRTAAVNFLATPLLVATIYLWVAILTFWGAVTGKDDEQIVTYLENSHGAEVILTDRNVHRLLSEERYGWSLGHGIVVLLALLAIPKFLATAFTTSAPEIQLITLFFITGLGLFALFLSGTLHARNLQIVRDIEQYAATHDARTACLITGSHHVPGVRTGLEDSAHVNVLEGE